MSRQSKAALAAIIGLLVGLGALAGVVLTLRDDEPSGSPTAAASTGLTGTGAATDVPEIEPPAPATETIDVGGFPNAVAVGGGNVWVVRDGRKLVRLDAATGRVVGRVGAGDEIGSERPCGVSVGADAVWVTTVSGQVAKISTKTGRLSRLVSIGEATCVAAGPLDVWVTSANGNQLTRLDAETGEVVAEIALEGFPQGVAVGFGSVWVATSDPPDGAGGGVSRIDPRSNEVVRTILVPNLPEFLAAGAGAIWATSNNGTVAELDPETNQLVATVRVSDGGATSIAVGGGSVWVVELRRAGEEASIYRIDAATAQLDPETVPAGRNPIGLAFGAGALWVTNFDDGTLTRYEP